MTEVYIAELDLATGRQLVEPSPATQRYAGSNHSPEWSSDGRQLLFLSQRGPGVWGARAICVRDMESGDVREIPSKLERMVAGKDRMEVWALSNFLPAAEATVPR